MKKSTIVTMGLGLLFASAAQARICDKSAIYAAQQELEGTHHISSQIQSVMVLRSGRARQVYRVELTHGRDRFLYQVDLEHDTCTVRRVKDITQE